MTTRRVSLALALLGVTALVVSAGGFSAGTVDRGISVAVVSDESAYLGVDANEPVLVNGHHTDVELFTLENQVDSKPLTVSILEVQGANWSESPPKVSDLSVETGDTPSEKRIVADVVCAHNGDSETTVENTQTITVHMEASVSDGGLAVRLSRDVKVTCSGDPAGQNASATDEGA